MQIYLQDFSIFSLSLPVSFSSLFPFFVLLYSRYPPIDAIDTIDAISSRPPLSPLVFGWFSVGFRLIFGAYFLVTFSCHSRVIVVTLSLFGR